MSTALLPGHPQAAGPAGSRPAAGNRARLLEPLPRDRVLGWLAPLAVAAAAGLLRFWRLDQPRAVVFDETYYAKDAFSLLRHGNEQSFGEQANERILAWDGRGPLDVFTGEPAFVAHPPAGKWVIASGEAALGLTPLGWRVAVAVVGTLSVLMLARIARRLFRSTLLGCTAGLLLALDGQHFVHSRTALLDLIVMFFALAGFGAILVDRDRFRERLAAGASQPPPAESGARRAGWGAGWRPWRLSAGVLLGLACATKWSGVFFLAVFGLMTVAWDAGARRAAGLPSPVRTTLLRSAPVAFVSLVGTAAVVYVGSWSGWLLTGTGWGRQWAAEQSGDSVVPDGLRSLWHYHAEMWTFNRTLDDPHPYASNPWSWSVLGRPVSFFYQGLQQGQGDCAAEACSRAVTALGTPALWWGGLLAVAVTAGLWLLGRDWRAGAALSGILGGYLPWFAFQGRTIYSFYAVAYLPWLVLCVTLCLGLVLGPRSASPARRRAGAVLAGGYVLLVAANFFWLYPVLTGQVVPYPHWVARMWLPSWI